MTSTLKQQPARFPRWLRPASGLALIAAGVWLLVFGLPDWPQPSLGVVKLGEGKPGEPGFPALNAAFSVNRLVHYRVQSAAGGQVELAVAEYDRQGQSASAIIYPPKPAASMALGAVLSRQAMWADAAQAIQSHTEPNALFVAWWDDAQRLQLLTGRPVWLNAPAASAFPDAAQAKVWQTLGGGFAQDETKSRQLAQWLMADADTALAGLAEKLPSNQPVYVVVSLDILARLGEIAALSGMSSQYQAQDFPATGDLHQQITAVRRWAGEGGIGSYLLQPLPNGAVRAWKPADATAAKTLLSRLLPFTASLAKPLDKLTMVYQSEGGFLTVYRLNR